MMPLETGAKRLGPMAELIQARRTVRLFKPDPVPRERIVELLNISVWAPTHGNRQPWRFILYQDKGRDAFAQAVMATFTAEDHKKYGSDRYDYYLNIPVHLVIVMKEDPRHKQWEEDYAAVCCLIQNFQLAAWEQGLGVVWKTNGYMHDPKFRAAAGVQPGEKIVGVLHAGYPETVPPVRPRMAAEELLTVIEA